MNPLDHIMGVQEAAELWGLSPGYIKNLCAEGKVKAKKIGRGWVLDKTQSNPKGGVKMRVWEREGYKVVEKEFDHDLHEFDVIKDGKVIATITPGDLDDMETIVSDLDAGEDVNGWEDGNGNTIYID